MKNFTLMTLILVCVTFVSCGKDSKSSGSSSSGFSNSTSANGYSTGNFQNKTGLLNSYTGTFTFGNQTYTKYQVSQASYSVISNALQVAKSAGNIIKLESTEGDIYKVNVNAAVNSYNGQTGIEIRTMTVVNYK